MQQDKKKSPPPEIKWTERISVGVKQIDDQHKRLIGIANKLIRAMHNGLAPKMVNHIVRDLREYTVFHFRDEEKLMGDAGYPHLPEHQREHRALTARVKEYQDALYRKQDIKPAEIRDFIKDWLINHILRSDGRLADFMRENPDSVKTGKKEAAPRPEIISEDLPDEQNDSGQGSESA